MYLTASEAKAAGLPSVAEQIESHNRRVTCKHEHVGTTDNPHVYECIDCGEAVRREVK